MIWFVSFSSFVFFCIFLSLHTKSHMLHHAGHFGDGENAANLALHALGMSIVGVAVIVWELI